ncbi:putative ABC-type exoprotein transport system permease subunit [Bacillus tianshenii]|uniref:ABC-type exoprotein transport system permease subunit n=1 Tax=Sutcliffiella tianshenii TaxID=1463404 RepID=A0ABS2P349_9BACI|nr:ABC transporter permease [Bacillus tianshenii]MBM7621386.1 putative ABC-type exoprotein transport system permease subunit [Bacillus tianshenii]
MSGSALFRYRYRKDREYQWKNIKVVMDWTILFYIFLTILFVGAMVYDSIPEIVEIISQLPFGLTILLIYLLLNNGSIRIFVEAADSYFFIHRKDVPQSIKGFSICVSLLKNTVISILIGCVSFLLLDTVEPGAFSFLPYITYIVLTRLLLIIIGQLIDLRWKSWSNRLISIAVFVLGGAFFYLSLKSALGISLNVTLLLMVAATHYVYWKADSFDFDVSENEKIKQKYVGMMFAMSEYVHIPKASKRTRPLLFRKSQRIFTDRRPENALAELFFKYLLRNLRHVSSYLKIIGITIAVMIYMPLWMKFGLFIAFFFFMKEWLNIVYDELTAHPFLNLYKGKGILKEHFQDAVTRWLYYPALGIVGFVLLMNAMFHFLWKG